MAKISIDTIQPAGASLFADDDSFISDLSEHEMDLSGGSGIKLSKVGKYFPFAFQPPQPALGFVLHPFGWDVAVFLNQGGYGGGAVPVAVTIARGGGSSVPAPFPGTSYPSGLGAGPGLGSVTGFGPATGYGQLW